jgi:hypothetical protein
LNTATSSAVDEPAVLDALSTEDSAECEAAARNVKLAEGQIAAANEKLRSENAQLQTELETMDLLYLHAKDFIEAASPNVRRKGSSQRLNAG